MSFFQFNRYVMLCCAISTTLPNFLEAKDVNSNFQGPKNAPSFQSNNLYDPAAYNEQNDDEVLKSPSIRTAFAAHILLQRYFSELKDKNESTLVSSDIRETYLKLLLTWLKTAEPIFKEFCNKDFNKVLTQEQSNNTEPYGEVIFQKLKTLLYLTPLGFEGIIPQNQWEISQVLGDFIKTGEFDSSVLLFLLNIGLEKQSVEALEAQNKLMEQTLNAKTDNLNANKVHTRSLKEAYTKKHKGWFTSEEKILKKLNLKKSELARYSSEERENKIWKKLDEIEKIGFREIIEETEEQTIQKEQEILNNKNKILEIYKKLDENHWFDQKIQENFWNTNQNNIEKLGFDISHEFKNEQLDFNYNPMDGEGQNRKKHNSSNQNGNNQNDSDNQNKLYRSNEENWNDNAYRNNIRGSNQSNRGSSDQFSENNRDQNRNANYNRWNRDSDRDMNNNSRNERGSNDRGRGSFRRNDKDGNYTDNQNMRNDNERMNKRGSNDRGRGSFRRNDKDGNYTDNQNMRNDNERMNKRGSNDRGRNSFDRDANCDRGNRGSNRSMNNDLINRRSSNDRNRSSGNRQSSDKVRIEGNKIYINGPIEITVHD